MAKEQPKRKYIKRSPYWSKFDKSQTIAPSSAEPVEPVMCGENFYVSSTSASCPTEDSTRTSGASTSTRRQNRAALGNKGSRFSNIAAGMLPYSVTYDGVSIRRL